jgi:hypothetical protein
VANAAIMIWNIAIAKVALGICATMGTLKAYPSNAISNGKEM